MTRFSVLTAPLAHHPLADLNESKRLPGVSYKLAEGYGLDVAFTDSLEIDEKRMAVWINYADGNRRDGVGDLLVVEGIDESRHRKNPIHLFDHGKSVTLPVGKVEDPETGRYTGIIDPVTKCAKDLVYYYRGTGLPGVDKSAEYDHALFCQQVFHLLAQKFIRGGSIGYQVIQARELPPEPMYGTPKGLLLLQVLKLESSTVVMPANADTVRKGLAPDLREVLAMPHVCGKPLSPMLVKSLAPYAPAKKAQLGYEGKKGKPSMGAGSHWGPEEGPSYSYDSGAPVFGKEQPSDDIDPDKARQILRDGEANGKPLTDSQRRMFGAAAGRDKKAVPPASPDAATVHTRQSAPPPQSPKQGQMGVREQADGWYVYDPKTGQNQFGPYFSSEIALVWARRLNMGRKGLNALRKKYRRTAKGLVRRLKRSSPGASVIYLAGKDLERARKEAEAKGIKFEHVSSRNGMARVKLIGDDGAIDEVAKSYGRLVKFQGAKALPSRKKAQQPQSPVVIQHAGHRFTLKEVKKPFGGPDEMVWGIWVDNDSRAQGVRPTLESAKEWVKEEYPEKRLKAQPLREPQRTNVHAGVAEAGEEVVARRAIMDQTGREYFAKPGDRLMIVGTDDVGRMRARNRAGVEQSVISNDVRRKAMGTKAVGAARAVIVFKQSDQEFYVKVLFNEARRKELLKGPFKTREDAEKVAEELARTYGVPFMKTLQGTKSNPLTLIVVGDEVEVIPGSGGHTQYHGGDRGIVKEVRPTGYVIQIPGEPRPTAFEKDEVKLVRKKALKGIKSMRHTKTKDGDDLPVGDEDTTAAGEERQLPLGAQVLRRLHEDATLLLQDYDEMLGPLENESVKTRLQGKLEGFSEELTELEEEFGKLYPDLGGLVGTKDDDALEDAADLESDGVPDNDKEEYEEELEPTPKDMDTMDDDAVGSSSEEREEVSPEDALEGMEVADEEEEGEKSLRRKVKRLRWKYGKKGVCPECGKEDCVCETDEKGIKVAPALVAAAAPAVGQLVGGALSNRDKGYVKEAGGFLGEIGLPESILDDESRMKSYHYHKTLAGMAQLDEAREDLAEGSEDLQDSGIPPAEFEPGAGAKGVGSAAAAAARHPRIRAAARGAVRGAVEGAASGKAADERQRSDTDSEGAVRGERNEITRHVANPAPDPKPGQSTTMQYKGQMEILGQAADFLKELAFLPELDDDYRGRSTEFSKGLNDFIGPDEEVPDVNDLPQEEEVPDVGVVMEEEVPEEEEPGMEMKFLVEEADLQCRKIEGLSKLLEKIRI